MPAAGFGQADGYRNLEPGERADLDEKVPVNFVFVGYDRNDVDAGKFLAGLPSEYKPVVRSRYFYNESIEQISARPELHLRLQRHVRRRRLREEVLRVPVGRGEARAAHGLPEALQRQLAQVLQTRPKGEPQPCQRGGRTRYQEELPHKRPCRREVARRRTRPRASTRERNTVFFINWWGDGKKPRAGFKHHVYTKTNEPDPDTGFDFGQEADSRKLIAWGGTTAEDEESGLGSTRRVWFHDLSAGPDSFTDNWNVDDPDLTGDGVRDYRLPPIWEYFTPGGYRSGLEADRRPRPRSRATSPSTCSSPARRCTRPSSRRGCCRTRSTSTSTPSRASPAGTPPKRYQTPGLVLDEVERAPPPALHHRPAGPGLRGQGQGAATCSSLRGSACYPEKYPGYPAEANLFLYGAEQPRQSYSTTSRTSAEYEAALLNWAVEDGENCQTSPPLLGFADDNYRDGTQSFIFSFVSPAIAEAATGSRPPRSTSTATTST